MNRRKRSWTKRAILFDLDDTLIAFAAVRETSWLQVCREYHQGNKKAPVMKMYEAIRKSNERYWKDEKNQREGRLALEAARIQVISAAFDELGLPSGDAQILAHRYSIVRLENMYLLPGVEHTLQTLLDRHYEMALITNGDCDTQRKKIEKFAVAKYFKHILIEEELGYGKPDQRIYLGALSCFDVSPQQSWMVGDNLNLDIGAPQSLGIRGIWYDPEGIGLPASAPAVPFRIIRMTADLLEILK